MHNNPVLISDFTETFAPVVRVRLHPSDYGISRRIELGGSSDVRSYCVQKSVR